MQRIAVAGRHRSITLTAIAQRASLAPATLRATCTELHTFQQTEGRDVDGLRDLLGEYANALPDLPQYQPLVWQADKGVVSCPLDGVRTGAYKQNTLFEPPEDSNNGKSEGFDYDGGCGGGSSGDCQ